MGPPRPPLLAVPWLPMEWPQFGRGNRAKRGPEPEAGESPHRAPALLRVAHGTKREVQDLPIPRAACGTLARRNEPATQHGLVRRRPVLGGRLPRDPKWAGGVVQKLSGQRLA